jgi:anti-sigma factor RsiW
MQSTPERPAPPRALKARRTFAAFAVGVAGVALTGFLFILAGQERIADELLASHGRATVGRRMIDVASSDLHTVKPWLSARLPYSPPVADFSAEAFELVGARLDHANGRPVAVLVYKRRQHIIDAYVWPAAGGVKAGELTRDGFHLVRFAANDMAFWLVSDLNRNELDDLARLLARQAAAL